MPSYEVASRTGHQAAGPGGSHLHGGDVDCGDAYYREAFGHLGVTSKADYEDRYGFEDEGASTKKRKKKKRT